MAGKNESSEGQRNEDFAEKNKFKRRFEDIIKNAESKKRARKLRSSSIDAVKAENEEKPWTETGMNSSRLQASDFMKPGLELAKFLLGKVIYRILGDNVVLTGRIVETEAYLGEIDKACHCYGGKRTEKTGPMYMDPGTAYVYFIYGMYFCLNVSSNDIGGCVLIRALQPITGQETMQKFRSEKRKAGSPKIKEHALCNGPSKLCTAMAITKNSLNKENMATSSKFWIEKDQPECSDQEIVITKRIGIDSYGVEWASKPYRFYLLGNKCVSIRDKTAEKELS